MSDELWCMHVPGPDDLWACASKSEAEALTAKHNAEIKTLGLAERLDMPEASLQAKAIPWPYSSEGHAAELRKRTQERT